MRSALACGVLVTESADTETSTPPNRAESPALWGADRGVGGGERNAPAQAEKQGRCLMQPPPPGQQTKAKKAKAKGWGAGGGLAGQRGDGQRSALSWEPSTSLQTQGVNLGTPV